jgi:selenocysteine lyase/cysteine desulfurase
MTAIQSYEQYLSRELLCVLKDCRATIYGIDTESRLAERVPTYCFNMPGILPRAVTEAAAAANIGIRDGHMYTPRLMKRLNLDSQTGAVRISLVHYNTIAEVHRLANVLNDLRS